jgi:hypothetical protein
MTRFDLHPEDLLERAARGAVNPAERARLEQHLAECAVCRVERALSAQAALDAAPLRDEKLVVARLKRDVASRLAASSARRTPRQRVVVAIALLAVGLVSVAAAATLVVARRAPAPQVSVLLPRSATPAAARVAPGARAASLEEPRVTPDAALALPGTEQGGDVLPGATLAPKSVLVPQLSSSELFSRANQARRDGKVAEAARLYRALQERFSGSSEELVSRVSLGRLLLDRLGDSRGALVQFNSYLASPGGGGLREEAMVGRALSLGRLGRAAEERAAWKALLDAWPKSTHRKRAEARLVELGGASATAGRAGAGGGSGAR